MESIAKYELREVLGQGGMGVVYRAYDPLMDRDVALKIIQERALDVPELKARFTREARMAGKLSHDNIAVIYDLGEADGKTFIVMEYLPGRNLRTMIDAREELTHQEKLNFAAQICRGLHFAHASGIVHRDIKPENIQVLPDRRIKIMDFGIAKPQLQGNVPAGAGSSVTLTSAGMRIGTPSYMSPEQVKGLPVDRRSDIFSLGVLLYELFTYTKPFRGDDTTVLYKIVHEDPEPLELEDSHLSDVMQRVIGKCLAKEPGARYDDCMQLLHGLQEVQKGKGHAGAPTPHQAQQNAHPSVLKMLPGNIVGETVSHFRILQKIGDGGMGTVYKAEDLTLKRIVALKFLLSEGTLNPRAKERFLMEAQAASALDHPNICTIYEIGETGGGLFFICMSYCVGEDLGKILHKRSLDVQEALAICIHAGRGLAKAHEHGIVHRDIKPANIIVSPTGDTKIVDFGLAKLSGGTQFTRMASVMGTLPYMSPEQIKGGEIDHRTDIWSLGVVLYQALTGKAPFEGAYEAALFYAIVNESPPPPSSLTPSLPPLLDAIAAKALSKKADDRYATMGDLLKDLERVHQEVSLTGPSEPGGSPELTTLLENGKTYLERRRFAEALSRFEAALMLAPGHAEAEYLRLHALQGVTQAKELDALAAEAESLLERGKSREAREVLLRISARDPQHQKAVQLLEQTLKSLERQERVEKLLLDAEFYLRRGKYGEARDSYQKVLQIDPAHKEASRGLKRTERRKTEETNRATGKTPLPAQSRKRLPLLILGSLLLMVLAAGSWYYLRPERETIVAESQTHSVTPGDQNLQEATVQSGLNAAPNGETKAPALAEPTPGLSELKGLVEKARNEMLEAKKRAERSGANRGSSHLFAAALRQELEGNRIARRGTEDALNTALPLYADARQGYRNATDGDKASPDDPPANRKNQDERETTVSAGPASPPSTPASPSRSGVEPPGADTQGGKGNTEIPIANNIVNAEAEARTAIDKLLVEYRESIEKGDVDRLGQLLHLPEEILSNWSVFFSSSDNRKVSIEGVNMDINPTSARVTFKTKMSFFNTQTNASQNSEYPRQWALESNNGIWRIVTQK